MELQINFNVWAILFLVAAAQGIFLAFVLFTSFNKQKANKCLAFLMLSFGISLFYYVAYWTGITKYIHGIFYLILFLPLLYGPLLLGYFRTLYNKKLETYHWIPFLITVLLTSFLYLPRFNEIAYPFFQDLRLLLVINVFMNIHLIIYSIYLLHLSKSVSKKHKQNRLLTRLSWCFTGFTISFLSYYVLAWTEILRVDYDYMVSAAMSFFIYYIGYAGYKTPEFIKSNFPAITKYSKSGLTENAVKHLADKLIFFMSEKKPHLDTDLKLTDLANQLSLSNHHLSQIINEKFDKNFSDFINSYRIEEAKHLLLDDSLLDERIISIAYRVGFNNKVSFYNTFRKHTGMSPSEYRKKQKEVYL